MGSKPHIAVLSSTVIGVLDFLINFFIAIITVPIFLGYWGTQKYGLWLMLQASFGIFQFFDFGLRTYAGYEINLRFGKDPKGSKAFLASTLLFVVCLSIIPIIFSLFLLFNPTLGEFFLGKGDIESNRVGVIFGLITLQMSHVLVGAPLGLINATFFPVNKLIQSQALGLFNNVFRLAVLCAIAFLNFDIFYSCLLFLAGQVVSGVVSFIIIKKHVPEFYPWVKGYSFKVGFQAFRKSLLVTINLILQQLSNNGLVIYLANLIGAAAVPAFTTLRTISNFGTKISNILGQATLLQLIKAHNNMEGSKAGAIIKVNWFVVGMIFNVSMLLADPFIVGFFEIWTHYKVKFDSRLYSGLLISASIFNFGFILLQYIVGLNDLRGQAIVITTKTVVLFGSLLFLLRNFGLPSLGYAILLSELFGVFVSLWLIGKYSTGKMMSAVECFVFFSPVIVVAGYFVIKETFGFNWSVYLLFFMLLLFIYYLSWKFLGNALRSMFVDILVKAFRKLNVR